MGNTPTGVGKTSPARHAAGRRQKHPHGRGEDERARERAVADQETPPRAWGRPPAKRGRPPPCRNTPTGVGKTVECWKVSPGRQKHPHGRGEDRRLSRRRPSNEETPPRAWGRRQDTGAYEDTLRNTPTGVGKTAPGCTLTTRTGKHPHGRGEDRKRMKGKGQI